MPIQTAIDSISNSQGSPFGFKNRIINGGMVIDQRNAGASLNPADQAYSLDRWKCRRSQASKYTVQQNAGSVTPPVGFTNYLGVTSSSAYTVGASDYFAVQQIIEGYNLADLGWGTSNAKTVTLSFWVYSSLTGTFGGALNNGAEIRAYGFTYTINAANTWEQKTITIAGDTTGTWLTTNGIGLYVNFNLGTGSLYGIATNGSWTAGSTQFTPSGTVSVVGTNAATWYVTGVQLEVGKQATSFDYRPYGYELSLCQRYYIKWLANATNAGFGMGRGDGSSVPLCVITYPATMRASPTLTQSNTLINTPTSYTVSGISSTSMGTNSALVAPQMATGTVTAGYACAWIANASTSYIDLSAEL